MRPTRILAELPARRLCLAAQAGQHSRRCFASAASKRASLPVLSKPSAFFISNRAFDTSKCLDFLVPPSARTIQTQSPPNPSQPLDPESIEQLAPHRRRQALKKLAQQQQNTDEKATPVTSAPDASSALTTAAEAAPAQSLKRTVSTFLSLSKPRLTVLVVLTAMVPYALYPVPEMLSPLTTETPSLSPLTLLFLTTGTALCSASANTLNMLYEPATDAKMSRTRNRPLVRRLLSTRAAVAFAVAAGALGTAGLYFGVNPTVAFLGAANIALYAGVYTPLKRITVLNTWVGAIVGGIPPLMGWAAAAGEAATKDGSWRELLLASDGSSIGGWLMAALLVAWQFPHFMALSWGIRDEYKNAGLRMLAWTNPARNSRVALRYSMVFIPICVGLCAAGVTEWSYAVTSLPVNLWLLREAVGFWKHEGHKGSAKKLFWASVWHLPALLFLAALQKKGMWTRAWNSIFGPADEDGLWEEEELEEVNGSSAK